MLINKDMAKDGVHGLAGMRHRGLQVQVLSGSLLPTAVKRLHPTLGVIQRLVHPRDPLHRLAPSWNQGGGIQGTQNLQGRRPFGQLRITGVHTGLVLDQIAAIQHALFLYPCNRVPFGMTRPGMPHGNTNATQIQGHFSRHLASHRIATTDNQGRPCQAWHRISPFKQTWKTLHLALHVLRATLANQLQRALTGDDLCRTFCLIRTRTQHAHRMVMGQQNVLDGLIAHGANFRNQVFRHQRRRRGVAHHDGLITNDHPAIGVTLSGISPTMRR